MNQLITGCAFYCTADWYEMAGSVSHLLIDGPEEIDFILKGIDLGLQLHLGHVGTINILSEERNG